MITESTKYILAENGYEINVGDKIKVVTAFTKYIYTVHRVTPKFAFVKHNGKAEGKYPRIYDRYFMALPKEKWNMTEYIVYKMAEATE